MSLTLEGVVAQTIVDAPAPVHDGVRHGREKSSWRCPACGGNDICHAHRVSAVDAAMNFVRPWVDRVRFGELVECITALWGADEARLARCGDCGLRSADPFVAGDARFYELAFGKESHHPYPASRWEYDLTRAVITSTTGTVLEIGAGDGAFQSSVLAEGVDRSRLHTTEFSVHGRRVLRDLGVKVTATDFRELPAATHAVVCGHQVFEHLDGLDEAFAAFDRLIAEDGIVAVSCPNGTHMARSEAAGGLMDIPPTHVSTWSFSAFNALARRHGWRVADYQEEPISRVRAAKELAVSRIFQARMQRRSLPALVERLSPTPRARYLLTAAATAAKLPSAFLASEPCGGSLWVAMKRA